jgi:hypothetical protein
VESQTAKCSERKRPRSPCRLISHGLRSWCSGRRPLTSEDIRHAYICPRSRKRMQTWHCGRQPPLRQPPQQPRSSPDHAASAQKQSSTPVSGSVQALRGRRAHTGSAWLQPLVAELSLQAIDPGGRGPPRSIAGSGGGPQSMATTPH